MRAKTFRIVSFSVAGILLAIVIAVSIACGMLSNIITQRLSSRSLDSTARQHGEQLAAQIEEEGIVMTKNDDVLPLDKTTYPKVNVFGWVGAHWLMGGSGSGRSIGSTKKYSPDTDLLKALSDYGITYNTDLVDMYNKFLKEYPCWRTDDNNPSNPANTDTLHTHDYESCRLYEPSVTDTAYYTKSILDGAKEFSDVALVVIGRLSGESNDAPLVQYKNYTQKGKVPEANTDRTRTYLDISTEEEALLTYVGQNFDKVVVLINSTNTMNLGFLDRIDGLGSCLIVGGTGNNAADAIPRIIYGDASPSGRLTDTYAYDFTTAATFANAGSAGVGVYKDTTDLYPAVNSDGNTNPNVGSEDNGYPGVSYLDYAESVYVGYRWYETADAVGFWDSEFAKSRWNVNGYEQVVQYPFGYGLSYSSFETTVTDASPRAGSSLEKDGKIKLTVVVHNIGPFAAKHVVQAYFVPEYTGKLEKPSVVLAAFAKTPVDVQPGEFQELTLEFDVFDMASYDCYGAYVADGGYVLEKGTYKVQIMENAHTLADAERGVTTYKVDKDIIYTDDPVSEKPVRNIFTGASAVDGFSVDGSTSGENIEYMTRANFESSFPQKTADREMAKSLRDKVLYTLSDVYAWADENAGVEMPVTASGGDLKPFRERKEGQSIATELGLLLGSNYNDPAWESALDQLTTDELDRLVLHGFAHEEELKSIGKPMTTAVDGPAQIGSFNQPNAGTGFPNPTVLGQTFNSELARSFGLAVGAEAQKMGIDGWYAPGVNLHRSPFGGRNYEYFSEDPVVSGVMAANISRGALQTGTYLYAKHIIGYDQESNRDALYCWMTEQALRELYLKPFKTAIDKGGLTGLMTSYGRIGAVWSGGSKALITSLLRNEWGYVGAVITDYSDHHEFMNGDQMIRAGGDIWMDFWRNNGTFKYETTSAAFRNAEREAAHHILYMILNAQYVNFGYDPAADGITITRAAVNGKWWIALLVAGDVLLVAGSATLIAFGIIKKDKKQPDDNDAKAESH